MKKLDLVKLTNALPYQKYNLTRNMHGIVVDVSTPFVKVMFFNPYNMGDFAIVNISTSDIEVEKEELPTEIKAKLLSDLENLTLQAKSKIEPVKIEEYAMVELIVEDKRYSRFGIHKGATGCVMDNSAVEDYISVDFSGIDENGEYYGDCISVKINDLKIIDETD